MRRSDRMARRPGFTALGLPFLPFLPSLPFLRLLPLLLPLLPLLGALGCASVPTSLTGDPDLAHGLRERGLDPATLIVPWQLNDEMRSWIHREVDDRIPADERLTRLLAVLLDPDGFDLTYQAGATGTAQEVFVSHRANCLAFTSLFVGLARELGVPVFYLDVGDIERFERDGSLVVQSDHVTAGYRGGQKLQVLEFTPLSQPNYRQLHRISDGTALALFYSNQGAALLRAGKEHDALAWLRPSVVIDPHLTRGWINLGVALRRAGDNQGAEVAYRRALEEDSSSVAAYQNLAALLFLTGRNAEGEELMALSSKLDSRNPFNLLALGDVALAHGRPEEARRFYRKAQRLAGAASEAEVALGQLALATGDRRGAHRWLCKAVEDGDSSQRAHQLAMRVGDCGALPATAPPLAGVAPGAASSPPPPAAGSMTPPPGPSRQEAPGAQNGPLGEDGSRGQGQDCADGQGDQETGA